MYSHIKGNFGRAIQIVDLLMGLGLHLDIAVDYLNQK